MTRAAEWQIHGLEALHVRSKVHIRDLARISCAGCTEMSKLGSLYEERVQLAHGQDTDLKPTESKLITPLISSSNLCYALQQVYSRTHDRPLKAFPFFHNPPFFFPTDVYSSFSAGQNIHPATITNLIPAANHSTEAILATFMIHPPVIAPAKINTALAILSFLFTFFGTQNIGSETKSEYKLVNTTLGI